jgi:hypothetical protein
MSEYAQRFAENAIDFSVLPDLTAIELFFEPELARFSSVERRHN